MEKIQEQLFDYGYGGEPNNIGNPINTDMTVMNGTGGGGGGDVVIPVTPPPYVPTTSVETTKSLNFYLYLQLVF